MYATLLSATLVSALSALSVRADDFAVPTIALTQCGSTNITFSGGVAPFDVAIVPNDDPCNEVLVDFGTDITTWEFSTGPLNITSGSVVMISIIDGNNEEAWSGAITVANGDDSCLTDSTSASASASASETDAAGATTLLLTSTFKASATKSASSSSESATIVGAANAGELGSSSGAVPALSHMSAAGATIVASLLALSAAFVL